MKSIRSFYFIFFAAAASMIPFLTLYYQELGLTGREIGVLTSIGPLMTLAGAPIWSAMADLTRKHHASFLVALIGAAGSVLFLAQVETFAWLIPAVIAYSFFIAPVIPLIDNTLMTLLTDKTSYGSHRVWGSYGWGIFAALTGWLLLSASLHWIFVIYLMALIILFAIALRLPIQQTKRQPDFWSGLRQLLTNRDWLIFLAAALVQGMSLSVFLNYLFLHLETMGASRLVMGFSLTIATISEIPVFLYSNRLLRKGAPFLLAGSLVFVVIRAFAYVGMTAPWQVLPISLLHGPTFAAMWAAGVAYADEAAGPGLSATAQGVFGGAVMGLGMAFGALVGGFLYERSGAIVAFQWAGWASLAALIFFIIFHRDFAAHYFQGKANKA